jgi:hypothetical protein
MCRVLALASLAGGEHGGHAAPGNTWVLDNLDAKKLVQLSQVLGSKSGSIDT